MKKRKTVLLLSLVLSLALTASPAAAQEKSLQVSMPVESSYTVYIPQSVTIVPPMEFEVEGEPLGDMDGAKFAVTAVTNTEPGYVVKVSVNKESFNEAGTGFSLTEKTDPGLVLTTTLEVRDTGSQGKYKPLTREDNTAAVFSGKTGGDNAEVSGGSLHFTAPAEKDQASGEYQGSLVFDISYTDEK